MNTVRQNEIIGFRISEIIVLKMDKPLNMSSRAEEDVAISEAYLKLENGLILNLSSYETLLMIQEDEIVNVVNRDKETEKLFSEIIGKNR